MIADKLLKYLRNLKKSKYIETEIINGSMSVRLTTKGKIKNLENPSNGIVDGKIRGISYDIPEIHKTKRQSLCRSLKRIGYKQLQKSMWICLYSKADQIDLIIDELNLNDYVAYFVIEKSNIDSHINKLFA